MAKKSKTKSKKVETTLPAFSKNTIILGSIIGFLVVALVTWGLIALYVEPVVARVNGAPLRVSDVRHDLYSSQEETIQFFSWIMGEEVALDTEIGEGLTVEDTVRIEAVLAAARRMIIQDLADEFGVTVTPAQINPLRNELFDFVNEHGLDVTNRELERLGVRDLDHWIEIQSSEFLRNNLVEYIVSSPEAFERFEEFMDDAEDIEILGAQHVLLMFPEIGEDEDEEEVRAELRERIETIRQRALDGEDFDYLIVTYGEDEGMAQFPQGYTFGPGEMVIEFEEATAALEIGGISEVVESMWGYHVIKRVEPDPDEYQNILDFRRMQGMQQAVVDGIQNMVSNAEIVHTRHLYDIPLGLEE